MLLSNHVSVLVANTEIIYTVLLVRMTFWNATARVLIKAT